MMPYVAVDGHNLIVLLLVCLMAISSEHPISAHFHYPAFRPTTQMETFHVLSQQFLMSILSAIKLRTELRNGSGRPKQNAPDRPRTRFLFPQASEKVRMYQKSWKNGMSCFSRGPF